MNSLLLRVIKGSNVLNLRADIDGYVVCLPEEMARPHRGLVLLFAAGDNVQMKLLLL